MIVKSTHGEWDPGIRLRLAGRLEVDRPQHDPDDERAHRLAAGGERRPGQRGDPGQEQRQREQHGRAEVGRQRQPADHQADKQQEHRPLRGPGEPREQRPARLLQPAAERRDVGGAGGLRLGRALLRRGLRLGRPGRGLAGRPVLGARGVLGAARVGHVGSGSQGARP